MTETTSSKISRPGRKAPSAGACTLNRRESSKARDPSSESVVYVFPVKIGMIKHIRNCSSRDHDAMYMPSWAQPCGAPEKGDFGSTNFPMNIHAADILRTSG